jgi:transcriptional regulator with XRE-family HTH domain
MHYEAPGLEAARVAAGLTIAELAQRTGYPVSVIQALEAGGSAHTNTISRLAANIGPHDLRLIRKED